MTLLDSPPPLDDFRLLLDLRSAAFQNTHEPVFYASLRLPRERRRESLQDRYVFFSFAVSFGPYLRKKLPLEFRESCSELEAVVNDIQWIQGKLSSFCEEWFKGLDILARDICDLNFISESFTLVRIAQETGAFKFPRIAIALSVQEAYIDSLAGRHASAAKIALHCVKRPYLLGGGKQDLLHTVNRLRYTLAGGGHIHAYRILLWIGVNQLTEIKQRNSFVKQIADTYRGGFRAFLSPDVPLVYRLPYLIAMLAKALHLNPLSRHLKIDILAHYWHLSVLYCFQKCLHSKTGLFKQILRPDSKPHTGHADTHGSSPNKKVQKPSRILVTRAMGGVGDILMMTPGLMALRKKHPSAQIDFAIPKSFHAMIEGLPGIRVIDINNSEINFVTYKKWINLTACPAGKVESRQYPNVRSNRIDIFGKALGVWRLTNRQPFYAFKEEEVNWSDAYIRSINPENLPVIGLQPISADTYKNWPFSPDLATHLSKDNLVLVFHHENLPEFEGENIIKVLQPFRRSAALLRHCKALVAVDSAFVHLAAALEIPTVAVFGPTSGKVFCRHYPTVTYVAPPKKAFPCSPCWRNEHTPCHLTGGRESICLKSISIKTVVDHLNSLTR